MRAATLGLGVVALGLGLVACGKPMTTPTPRRTTLADGRTVFGTIPEGPVDRAALRALPTVATYRWALPSAHFSGVMPAEDSASVSFAAHEDRSFASEVLRLNGWREAATESAAQFEITVLRVERTAEWLETRPDPRPPLPDRNSCRNLPRAQRANCVEPMPQDRPPIRVRQRGLDVRYAVAIVRLQDRASAWWISPVQSEIQIAILRLLTAGAESPPALLQ